MQIKPSRLLGLIAAAIISSYLIGKNSNPAKVEVKTVEVEKIVYVEKSSKAAVAKKVSSTTTKPDGTKVENTTETFGSVESTHIDLDSNKSLTTETKVKNSMLGLYLGVGVKSEELLKPYLSGVLTYDYLAFVAQSDLKLDHRIAGHIGFTF